MKLLISLFFSLLTYILALSGLGLAISLAFTFAWFMASDQFLFIWEFSLIPKLICSIISLFAANYVIMDYVDCECEREQNEQNPS